jgi:NAD dependent epimerase/dehydratase family enzyme
LVSGFGAARLTTPSISLFSMSQLRTAQGVLFGLPATKLMLEIGAVFMKTETELILKSRRVIAKKLMDSGFKFKFENWQKTALNLCSQSAQS